MSVGIRVVANPSFFREGTPLAEPEWLSAADVEAYDGRGFADTHPDASLALRFDDQREALVFWRQQSKVRPVRDDGQPNRPLTALTVSIEPLPD